ncbi:tripartite tricarboxylate transporter TctB family protein [Prosthecomicrobium sp. N25]|uniref:tripartite tricarboxylate transporter TctB family protein n=1 Tax=Prosthecomicrobium sp. N25 TaxID=3129254 RepID=UPI003077568A
MNDAGGGSRHWNQSTWGGIVLVAVALVGWFGTGGLAIGTLGAMGPGLLPRALAAMVGVCGVALLAIGLVRLGEQISGFALRGAVMVPLAIVAFALTIRSVDVAGFKTPGLGLAVAGPLAVLIGGHATPEAKLGELLPLSLILTAFCLVLFGDALNLPIPIFPEEARPYFAGWTQRGILRAIAAAMAAAGLLLALPKLIGLFGRRA